jgi:hypothetical protein
MRAAALSSEAREGSVVSTAVAIQVTYVDDPRSSKPLLVTWAFD